MFFIKNEERSKEKQQKKTNKEGLGPSATSPYP